MSISLFKNDIPDPKMLGNIIAVDTETQGLNIHRDKLCVVQLSSGDGNAILVQFADNNFQAPNLKKLLSNPQNTLIFHFARFDLAILRQYLDVTPQNVFCTKIASKLVRTYTEKHGLADLTKELLNLELDKSQQQTDWAATDLTKEQQFYAAQDVLYLHRIKDILETKLKRENRDKLANELFIFLQQRVTLDINGWGDIFAHH